MPKNPLMLFATLLLLTTCAAGQMASGNVAQSGPYARWELLDAQNPPLRTFEGCVLRDGSDHWLIPRKGKPWLLNYTGDGSLDEFSGNLVRTRGRENIGSARTDKTRHAGFATNREGRPYGWVEIMIDREINVEQIQVVTQSCPPDWFRRFQKD